MSDFNVDYDQLKKRKIENGDIIPMGSDTEYMVEFHMARVENFEGTDFVEVPHLRLQAPGNTKTVYDQPVRLESVPGQPSDPERFPKQWAAFQAGQNHEAGTSLYAWDDLTAADARRFELAGIKTIEQLASVADVHLSNLGMGAMALRERARKHLSGDTVETQLRQQLGEQAGQIDKLTDVVNTLLEKLGEKAEAPKAKAKAS